MDRQIELFFFHGEIQAIDQNDSLKTVEYDTKKILGLALMNLPQWDDFLRRVGRTRKYRQKIHINTPIPPPGG